MVSDAQGNPRWLKAIVAMAIITAGCTAGTSDPATTPGHQDASAFNTIQCPARVTATATRQTICGTLTVPEDRSDPDGPSIDLFVVRLEPNKPTDSRTVVFTGTDIGAPIDYFALAGMADHLNGPEVVALEARGTGYSEPNLSCPEVEAVAPETLPVPVDDPKLRRAFLGAVNACYERFATQGTDLSAYNIEEGGADLLDLVDALGLTSWDVITKGSTSRFVFEALRSDPPGLHSIVATSPEFPSTDTFAEAIQGTRAAVSQLAALCAQDSSCARLFPSLGASFDAAIRRFDRHPQTVRIKGRDVLVDGARLLRDLRNLLAAVATDSPMYLHLPATIDALAHAKNPTGPIAAVVSPELSAPTFCTGYLPWCGGPTSQGAYYSALCANIAPFADPARVVSLAGDSPAWEQDYVDSPYRDVCEAWPVTAATDSAAQPIESDVPLLVFRNGLDPSVAPETIGGEVGGFTTSYTLVTPTWGHASSLIPACPDAQPRNRFLADSTSAPNYRCQNSFRPRFATSPLGA